MVVKNVNYKAYRFTQTLDKEDGTQIKVTFVRKSMKTAMEILMQLKALGVLDNDVTDVSINKYTNEITVTKKLRSKLF